MRKLSLILAAGLAGAIIGYASTWGLVDILRARSEKRIPPSRIVAKSENERYLGKVIAERQGDRTLVWTNSQFGALFYCARVYLEPLYDRRSERASEPVGYSVHARVYIGPDKESYYHNCGQLGTVQNESEAVAKWGMIEWREDGVHIGSGTNHYFLPRARIESHR